MSKEKIRHKELLSFVNLTNLSWEFVDLKAIKEGNAEYQLEGDPSEATYLNNLLTPGVFARRDAEGDIEEFVYMEDIESSEIEKIEEGQREIKYKEKEQGLVEMRQKAGIAMEYLEKWENEENKEGQFLKDWEVIYGADSYEIMAGYLDSLWGLICSKNPNLDKDKKIYPKRKDIESNKEDKARVEFIINLTTMTLSIATADISRGATEISLSSILKTVASGQLQSQAEEKHVVLAFGVALIFNFNDPLALLEDSLDSSEELFIESLSEEFKETIELLEENNNLNRELEINFTEEFDMSQMDNDDFRILALKKDDEIVIVNQSKKDDNKKVLPKELDLLQMVFTKLRADNSDEDINFTFTGFEGGADLSFVNTLLYADKEDSNAKLFYKSIEEIKDYLNFTPENINDEYKSLRKIKVSGLYNAPNEAMSRFLWVSIAKALRFSYTKLMTKKAASISISVSVATLSLAAGKLFLLSLLIATFSLVISGIINWVESKRVKRIYDYFKEFEMIKEEENGIKGYLTDEFIDEDYIIIDSLAKITLQEITDLLNNKQGSVMDIDFKEIKIKKEDVVSMLLKFSEIEEFKVNKVTDDIITERGIEYEIKINGSLDLKERAGDKTAMELSGAPSYQGMQRSEYSLGLKKDDESGIYNIAAEIFREDPPPALYDPVNFINSNDEMLLQGRLLTNLMEIMATMQRNSYEKEDIFEFIYLAGEIEDPEIKINKGIPEASKTLEWCKEESVNEFAFMPLIDRDSGNIKDGAIKDNLRDEYIASVFRSKLEVDKNFREIGINQMHNYEQQILEEKYRQEIGEACIKYDFDNTPIKEKLLEIMQEETIHKPRQIRISFKQKFNYYKQVLNKLEEDIEKYYEEDNLEENHSYWGLFTDVKGKIHINTEAKSQLEYKYNPDDYILGRKLELNAINVCEGELEYKNELESQDKYDKNSKIAEVHPTDLCEDADVDLDKLSF